MIKKGVKEYLERILGSSVIGQRQKMLLETMHILQKVHSLHDWLYSLDVWYIPRCKPHKNETNKPHNCVNNKMLKYDWLL